MKKVLVKYSGKFGFIKPWTSVRDGKTRSSFYLTQSILMGIERKLFPSIKLNENGILNYIEDYLLDFDSISFQTEVTNSINLVKKKSRKINYYEPNKGIVSRGVLINPILYLVFRDDENIKETLLNQHICLCRNEDILYPIEINEVPLDYNLKVDNNGYTSCVSDKDNPASIYCGQNKYTGKEQYIDFEIIGEPSNLIINE